MFGAMICTTLSDKFGRKPIFLFSHWVMVIVGVANAFAPNYYVFVILRFFIGISYQVYPYILCNSIVGFLHRKLSRRPLKCYDIGKYNIRQWLNDEWERFTAADNRIWQCLCWNIVGRQTVPHWARGSYIVALAIEVLCECYLSGVTRVGDTRGGNWGCHPSIHVYVRYMSSSVRLSSVVCLSVTFVHPTQAIEIFGNVSTPFGTLAIPDLSIKNLRRSSQGNPYVGELNTRGAAVCSDFGYIERYISETVQDRS